MTEDVRVVNSRESDAGNTFRSQLSKAQESGRWMAAAWTVKDGEIRMVGRTCWNFPKGDFLAAVGHLAANLFEETRRGDMLPDDPLPMRATITPDLLSGRVGRDSDIDDGPTERPDRDDPIGPMNPGGDGKESMDVDADE